MLWASVAYASGIVTGFYIWRPPLWWLIAAIVFAASAAFFLRSRAKAAFALGFAALFVAGAWTMQVRMPTNHDADILAFADGREVIVTAHVVKEGILQEKSRGDVQQRLDLRTEHIHTGSETVTVDSGLRVSFSLTLIGTLLGEMFGSQRGLGYLLMTAIGLQNVRMIMAVTLLLVLFAASVSVVLIAIDRRLHRVTG